MWGRHGARGQRTSRPRGRQAGRRVQRLRSLAANLLTPALGVLSGPALARALEPEGRGQLAAILQPMTLATGVACLGAPVALNYFAAKGRASSTTVWRSFLLITPVSIATYLAMCAYGLYLTGATDLPLWVFVACWLGVPVGAYLQLLRGYWRGHAAWFRLDLERFAAAPLRLAVILALWGAGITSAAVYAGAQIVILMLVGAILFVSIRSVRASSETSMRSLWAFSLSAWPTSVLLFAGPRLDQALMPGASTTAQLGLYAVAATVAEIPLAITTIMVREALHTTANGMGLLGTIRSLRVYFGATLLMVVGILVTAPVVVPLVFGQDFGSGVSALQVLALGVLPASVLAVAVSVLEGLGLPRVAAAGPALYVLITAVCFAAFWGRISALDAALISTAAQSIAALVAVLVTLHHHRRHREVVNK